MQPALDWLGLRFDVAPEVDDPPGWLGLETNGSVVRTVVRDTPAWQAGVNVDDELLALDDIRWERGTWGERSCVEPEPVTAQVMNTSLFMWSGMAVLPSLSCLAPRHGEADMSASMTGLRNSVSQITKLVCRITKRSVFWRTRIGR